MVSATFSAPVDGILLQTPSTKLLINDQELGTGTLYITETNVVWDGGVSPSGTPVPSISLLYPSISIHAVQRDPISALYMVLNYDLRLPGFTQTNSGGGDANDDDDDDDDEFDPDNQPITQLRFIPHNEHDLPAMYSAMSQGQSMNPDPGDEANLDEDNDDPYEGEDYDDDDEEESGVGSSAPQSQSLNGDHNCQGDGQDEAMEE